MKDLVIIGAGGFGREVLQILKDINRKEPVWNVRGFLDADKNALENYACDISVIGTIDEWSPRANEVYVCGISSPKERERVVRMYKERGAAFVSLIHPTSMIADFVTIGEGAVIYANTWISTNARIGNFVSVLPYVTVGHDVTIGDFSMICSHCDITGKVAVGRRTYMGSRVSIIPDRKIGDGAYICAGSTVLADVKPNTKVMGYPAVRISG